MPQSKALESVQLLHEKSRYLQTRSTALLNESRDLCLASHKLRKAHAFGLRRQNLLRHISLSTTIEEDPPSPGDEAGTIIHCELIRIRTPGFDRNAPRKIIKPEI